MSMSVRTYPISRKLEIGKVKGFWENESSPLRGISHACDFSQQDPVDEEDSIEKR